MADWSGCVLFSLVLLTCFSVCAAGEYCNGRTGGYAEGTYCANGCCTDDLGNGKCCSDDNLTLGLSLGLGLGGTIILFVCVCACRYAYYKQRQRTQRVVVGRLDITVVRTVQHEGYGYDQPAQVSSLGRQSDTATPPNQGGSLTPLHTTGAPPNQGRSLTPLHPTGTPSNQGRSLTPLHTTGTRPNQGRSLTPLFPIAPPPNPGGRSSPLAPTGGAPNQERPPIILHARGRLPPNLKVGDIVTLPYEGPLPGLRTTPPTSGLRP